MILVETKLNEKLRAKYVILTFLCCNRGKKYTAKQICDFIVRNNLNSRNSEVHHNAISRLVEGDKRSKSVLQDVQVEKRSGRNYYYMEALP